MMAMRALSRFSLPAVSLPRSAPLLLARAPPALRSFSTAEGPKHEEAPAASPVATRAYASYTAYSVRGLPEACGRCGHRPSS